MYPSAGTGKCLPGNENKNKREFLKELAFSLIKPHLDDRSKKPGLHKSLANSITEILHSETIENPILRSDKLDKRKRCNDCTGNRDKVKKKHYTAA